MFPQHLCDEKLYRDCFLVTHLFHGGVVRVTGTTYWYCCWRIEIDDFRCWMPLIVNTNSWFAEHARSWKRALTCVAAYRCWCPRGLLTTGLGSRSRSRLIFPAVLRIRDILVRIRIRGSVHLTNGSGSGSWCFRQRPLS